MNSVLILVIILLNSFRSILTVPWIELGGKVTIACPKTNYSANIEFKCKQFFSSDVNKVSANSTK